MITSNLRISDLSPAALDWYLGYLRAMDDRDVEACLAHLSADVAVRFGNDAAIRGKPAVRGVIGGYFNYFSELEHELLNIYGTDRRFALESVNHYTRRDGKCLRVNAAVFTDRGADGLVTSIRIFSDVSSLFRD